MEKKKTPGVRPECRRSPMDLETLFQSDEDDESGNMRKRKRAKRSAKISTPKADCKHDKFEEAANGMNKSSGASDKIMDYDPVPICVYHGGTIRHDSMGCNYEGQRPNVFHANPEIRFDELKHRIYSLTGWPVSRYELEINARWQAGRGGRLFFVLIPITDDDSLRSIIWNTQGGKIDWSLIELYVGKLPKGAGSSTVEQEDLAPTSSDNDQVYPNSPEDNIRDTENIPNQTTSVTVEEIGHIVNEEEQSFEETGVDNDIIDNNEGEEAHPEEEDEEEIGHIVNEEGQSFEETGVDNDIIDNNEGEEAHPEEEKDEEEIPANGTKQSSGSSDEVEKSESLVNRRKRTNTVSVKNNFMYEDNGSNIQKKPKTKQNSTEGGRRLKKGENSLMCHQCQRNDKGRVVHCICCKTKRFCVPCMMRWYPHFSEQEIAEKCPVCRKNCNCMGCLRKYEMKLVPTIELSKEDKVKYGQLIVKHLYPWLKEFNCEQNAEKVIEARIKGIDERDFELPLSECEMDKQIYCNKCQTSIVDFHRTCLSCAFKLCIACSRELREHHSPTLCDMEVLDGNAEMLSNNMSVLFGKEAVLGDEEVLSYIKPDVWAPWADGQILCPPERLGGCDSSVLELHSVLGEHFISQLVQKITEIAASAIPNYDFPSSCECSTIPGKLNSRKAANRKKKGDNCVYCPQGREVAEGQLGHFQKHWMKGEPVVVRNVLELTSGLSWEPMVMWRALRETKCKDQKERLAVTVFDCRDRTHTEINTHHFFTGYEKGLSHKDDWPMLLKVKYWPPEISVYERLPRHGVEFISALPFKEYTDPRCGPLNLAVKLPETLLKSDLGLKMDIAYGIREELVEGNSVTKLHCNMADEISILTHTLEVKLTAYQRKAIENKHKNYNSGIKDCKTNGTFEQEEKSNIIGKKINAETNINPDDSDSKEYGGALWDIWRREDVPKLIEYLKKHSREFTYYENKPIEQVAHPIHDQSFYLTMDHKRKLKEEYGIEAWTFEQKRGEAVLIPAGCPHQVRNLKSCIKVALDFVSPENFGQCIELSNQFRLLPEGHRAKKDKFEVKKIAIYALKKAVDDIEGIDSDRGDKYHDGQSRMTKRKRSVRRKESGKEKPTEEMDREQADVELNEEREGGNSYELEEHSKEEEMIIDNGSIKARSTCARQNKKKVERVGQRKTYRVHRASR